MVKRMTNLGVALVLATLLIASQAVAAATGILVSGSITDPASNPYALGTYTFTFVAGPGGVNLNTNQSVATQTGALNGSGAFSGVLLGNTDTLGGGSRWQAYICAANGQCFTVLFNVTSTTSSLSTLLSSYAPLLTSPFFTNLLPSVAATYAVGSASLPWTAITLGTAATDALTIEPAAFGQGTVMTIPDPGATTATANGLDLTVENCGATTGATQACVGTVKYKGIAVFGNVTLNSAATQAITTLPFTAAGDYACWGSDYSSAAGIVSFSVYTSGASATIKESGGATTDVLYYSCVGF